jgi:hypothetical protein
MTIETRPQFFFVGAVTLDNQYLNFDDGDGELSAILNVGSRSPESLLIEAARAMNEVGGQTYTITLDRETNLVTISASADFDLLITSGSAALQSVFSLLGFTGADLTGANTYTGNVVFASVYRPQFYLQNYTPFQHNKEAIQASINESASGVLEIISFGRREFMEFSLDFVTDVDQGTGGPIETDADGVASTQAFMDFLIDRAPLEFMPDRDDPDEFETIQLEKTATNSTGTGYKLREMFGKGLAGYYESGVLTFRKVA